MSSVILYHKVIIVIMPIMFISLKGISRAEIDHVTELFRMEKNEGQWTCKVCGIESNKKANIQNHVEIYMRVSSKTTLSISTYPAKICYVFVNSIDMFRQMFL